jgi:CheY-like chemotaxis protein
MASQKVSVLFVDDSPVKMESYPRGLDLRGMEVHVRESVDKALTEFAREDFPYQAVILDSMMPAGQLGPDPDDPECMLTGKRLYKRLREVYGRQEPVILLSNYAYQRVLEELADDPTVRVLDKGTTRPSHLHKTILDMLAPHPAAV